MNEFFHFSLFERRGIGTLLVCLVLLIWLPRRWSPSNRLPEEVIWQEVPPEQRSASAKEKRTAMPRKEDSLALTIFDPNTVAYETLTDMGLPPSLARGWINYRGAGAHFRYREDLLRLYQMDSLLFAKLEPFIDLPRRPRFDTKPSATAYPNVPNRDTISISINQSATDEWALLRGIGPVLSSRIVAFRDKLGGFSSIDQVAETFGLPDSTFQQIKEHLRMDTPPAKLSINALPAEQLAEHPYISWKQAKAVTSFRTNHGPFSSVADFQVLRIFTVEEHRRLEPYLDFTFRRKKRSGKSDSLTTVQ